jgi:hypothetical protein
MIVPSGRNETINWARGLDIFLSCDKGAATNASTLGLSANRKLSRNGLGGDRGINGDLLEADFWTGIASGLPVRTKPLVRRIESSGVARGVEWR